MSKKARSDNWRINKSGVMAIEGAAILRSLQKVAGAAGLPKDYKVTFASKRHMSGINFDKKEIIIGAGRIFNEAPLPANLFDVLVGLTLHEVGHKVLETNTVEKDINTGSIGWIAERKKLLHHFVNIGEDIAIESRVRANPNISEYDEALHNWGVENMREADVTKLLEVWIEYALGHKSVAIMNIPESMTSAMHQLVALTSWLRSTIRNPRDRAMAYLKYWVEVESVVMNPPKPEPPPPEPCEDSEPSNETESGESESESEEKKPEAESEPEPEPNTDGDEEMDVENPDADDESEETDSNTSGEEGATETEDVELDRPLAQTAGDEMDEDLVDQINEAVVSETEDITDEVREAFTGQAMDDLHSVIRSRETRTPKIKPNMYLRKRLERIMTIKKRLQARTMHGEQYGRIDKRHLHRVATDERIFSLRYKFPDGFPKTRILLDLSGSMSGRQSDEVLEAAGSLQTLVDAEVWCYYNQGFTSCLVRVDDGKLIHTFESRGNTPSGVALVGVALGMKKGGVIIHLTDGGHNCGQSPWNATWILKKNGIDVVHIIWGGEMASQHYVFDKMKCKRIRGISEFPDALYEILVEQTKLSKMGGK